MWYACVMKAAVVASSLLPPIIRRRSYVRIAASFAGRRRTRMRTITVMETMTDPTAKKSHDAIKIGGIVGGAAGAGGLGGSGGGPGGAGGIGGGGKGALPGG